MVRGGDWLSVVSTATRGYNHCWLFFSCPNICSFNNYKGVTLPGCSKQVVRIVAQGPDSWFGVLGLSQGKLIVLSACFIDIILFIYLFCFHVLALLSSLLSTAPCPLLSSPPRSRKQEGSSKGGHGWENIITVERFGGRHLVPTFIISCSSEVTSW